RGRARSRAGPSRGAAHAGPADSPGDPGRRQHACVRQEPESGRNDRARRLSSDAAPAAAGAGPRCVARRRARDRRRREARGRAAVGDRAVPHVHHGASPFPVAPTLAVLLVAFADLRGWVVQRSSGSNAIRPWRAVRVFGGLFSIWLAVGSPLAALDHEWLTVHMVQHLLLMTLGPPLVWVGAPAAMRRWRSLAQPAVCWLIAGGVLIGWHVPVVFTLGMQSAAWH